MSVLEKKLEKFLFASRWLMVPFYLGLVFSLALLLITFTREMVHFTQSILTATEYDVILGILTMIDLSLAGNLVIMVVFAGYENFVSKMDQVRSSERPAWMGNIDFSAMKLKLLGSIIAISAIHLLKTFYNLAHVPDREIKWLLIIHGMFVLSAIILSCSDKIGEKKS